MKVVVTGAAGSVAGGVIKVLAQRGHELILLDRKPVYDRPGRFVYIDLRDRARLQPIMEQAEALVHMGEIPNVNAGGHPHEEVFSHNCAVSSTVLQIATELKYKSILYTSSIQIYGTTDMHAVPWAKLPVDETYPIRPRNAYGAAKAAVELYARQLCDTLGVKIASFRLPWVMSHDPEEHWLRHMDGHFRKDLGIYVRSTDIGECFALAIEKQRPGFEAYNLSAREVVSGVPLVAGLKKHPELAQLPDDWPKYKSPYLYDKAKEHFGFEPRFNMLDLFRQKFGREPNEK